MASWEDEQVETLWPWSLCFSSLMLTANLPAVLACSEPCADRGLLAVRNLICLWSLRWDIEHAPPLSRAGSRYCHEAAEVFTGPDLRNVSEGDDVLPSGDLSLLRSRHQLQRAAGWSDPIFGVFNDTFSINHVISFSWHKFHVKAAHQRGETKSFTKSIPHISYAASNYWQFEGKKL